MNKLFLQWWRELSGPTASEIFAVGVLSTWDDWRNGKIDGSTPEGHARLKAAGCNCVICNSRIGEPT